MTVTISQILFFLISLFLSYLITKKIYKKIYIKKTKTAKITKKRIDNINKHLRIADSSNNLHEVRMHARKAMKLINRYGLVEEYRKILNNK